MDTYFETHGYHITFDQDYLSSNFGISTDLMDEFEQCDKIVSQAKSSGLKKLQRLIKKHPRNPQFKMFLAAWYSRRDNFEQAVSVNKWMVAEHPDFVFGRINLALGHYRDGEYEEMKTVLSENFDLKEIYPDKDVFHAHEVLSMLNIAVCYYAGIEDFNKAEELIEEMEEIDPYSVVIERSKEILLGHEKQCFLQVMEEEERNRIKPQVSKQRYTDTMKSPKFHHEIINELYEYTWDMPSKIIEDILNLPRQEVIADLELVLHDSIERFSYFDGQLEEDPLFEFEAMFVVHSVLLLAELKAYDSLSVILKTLRQSEGYTDLYYSSFLTDGLWEVVVKLGKDQLSMLDFFLKSPGIYTLNKSPVIDGLQQIAIHYPEKKKEVVEILTDLLAFYNNSTLEDNVIDSEVNFFVIVSLAGLGEKEFLSVAKQLYDKEWVVGDITDGYEELKESINEGFFSATDRNMSAVKELYREMKKFEAEFYRAMGEGFDGIEAFDDFDYFESFDNDLFDFADDIIPSNSMPIIKNKKTGRNEPCPCGSGKKYKKCCIGL